MSSPSYSPGSGKHTPLTSLAGYRMPAEWEAHQATWFSWPYNRDTWPDGLSDVDQYLAVAVEALLTGESVRINVQSESEADRLGRLIQHSRSPFDLTFHIVPTNDAWCRDHGAIFVTRVDGNEPLVATDWSYNAWGGKYPPFDDDNRVPRHMGRILDVPVVSIDLVLEGGSIEVNGNGLLLTTEDCLLNPNRNPGRTRDDIERLLERSFGVNQILWLGGDLIGDDTDGHIDNLARFVAPNVVIVMTEDDPGDPNHHCLSRNLEILNRSNETGATALDILKMPMPTPIISGGTRLPGSYANFYVGNTVVLLPVYGCPQDDTARGILNDVFPSRDIVPIDCRDIIKGLGAVHCLSQQVPAV